MGVSGDVARPTLRSTPRQNRVTPLGDLIAVPERGLVYGNRGCVHDEHGSIRRRYAGRRWIACRLQFRGWRRAPLMQPGRYTELFFLDDATALAAGHRPCALCRLADFRRLADVLARSHPTERGADAVDARLHVERLDAATRRRRLHETDLRELPDAAFVLRDGSPYLVWRSWLLRWASTGYVERLPRPARGGVQAITPPSLVAVLQAGWEPLVPLVHPSAWQLVDP
jgi:hypothetical protein